MNWNTKNIIAVALAVIVVLGFFYLFNRPLSPNDLVNEGVRDNIAAAPLQGFQQLIEQGNTELVVEDISVGEGEGAQPGDRLTVHYVGILTDGTQFDSSVSSGQPFVFTLGAGQVIPGWDRGLVGMKEGGRRILIVPPELGYGAQGAGDAIPPNATLIFEVLLMEIRSTE